MGTGARFGELITAMVTPFDGDGQLNEPATRALVSHLVDTGSDGIVVSGTTGESPTTTRDEKLRLFEIVVDEAPDEVSVIAGTGSYDTRESIELTEAAGELGIDACLIVTPYYSKPPQDGLLAHFRAIATASAVPVIVYDIPSRSALRVERPTMVELAAHPKIVAVKDAVGDAGETARLRRDLDAAGHHDFEIYSGDDGLLMPHLAAGATGIVSVCAHLVGRQMKQVLTAWSDGKNEEAVRIYTELVPLFSVIMGVTASPIPVKYALKLLGHDVGDPRLPLVPPSPEQVSIITGALEEAGLL